MTLTCKYMPEKWGKLLKEIIFSGLGEANFPGPGAKNFPKNSTIEKGIMNQRFWFCSTCVPFEKSRQTLSLDCLLFDLYSFNLSRKSVNFAQKSSEPAHDKTNRMACAPSEDSYQPEHLPSMISLRCPHEESLGLKLPIESTATGS